MLNGACDHESLSGQRLFLISHFIFKSQIRQQMIQYLIVLIILKVLHPRIREHTADPVDGTKLLRIGPAHGVQVKIEMAADHFRIRKTDPSDSESKDQPRQRRMGRSLRRLDKILIGFLPESLHRHDGIAVTVQMENIIEFMDESRCDKLLQRHLGKSVDIQRIPAHKQVKTLDLFRLTLRICAVEGLHIIHTADLRRPAADRTDLRDITDAASCQVVRDLWDDHVRLVDRDPVPGPQLQSFHDTDVMDTGAAHRRSLKLHRFEHGDRIDESCSRRTPLDVGKRCLLDLVRPFESDGIPREFRRPPKRLSIGDIIIKQYKTIRRDIVIFDLLRKSADCIGECLRRHLHELDRLKSQAGEPQKLLFSRIFKVNAIRPHQCKRHKTDVSGCRDLTVQLAYGTAAEISRILVLCIHICDGIV